MVERLLLTSSSLETEFHVFVSQQGSSELPRLFIILDGDDQFKAATLAATELQERGEIPPLLLVGVGYGGGYRSDKNRRGRDYTPTASPDEPSETGGAARFHHFLENELLPWLRARFSFVDDDYGITGHSLGALFVTYAAFQPKPIFKRYLSSSPSLWWDNRALLNTLSYDESSQRTSIRLFLSVGLKDSESMTGDLSLFEEKLATAKPSFVSYVVQRFPSKDHFNVLPVAFAEGFRWLMEKTPKKASV